MIFATLLSTGCVYEEHIHLHDDTAYSYDEEGLEHEEDAAREVQLAFEPDVVAPGETFLGYITVEQGDISLSSVADLTFYGDAVLDSWDAREGEIIVSITVAADAEGALDLVVETDKGDALWLEAAVAIRAGDDQDSAGGDEGGQAGSEGSDGTDGSDEPCE